jgi:hypothetical protein
VKESKPDAAAKGEEFPEKHFGALEYSVFGWFRYVPEAAATTSTTTTVLLRLTNNEEAIRADAA